MKTFVAASVWLGKATVLALVVGFLAACNNEEANNPDVVVVSPSPTIAASPSPNVVVVSPTTTTTTTASEPITDVVVIASAPDQQSLVNRQVQFANVPVQSVIGDRTFWVGSGNDQRLLVVLDEALDSGNTERALDVNAGQTLTMNGIVRRMPNAADAQKQWGLSATEANSLQNQRVYLQASQVQTK